jgi:Delta3-Delta2-enoyl-CoA isomerase
MPALDAVERSWRDIWRAARAAADSNAGGGALVIVGKRGQDRFFCNGACSAGLFSRVNSNFSLRS